MRTPQELSRTPTHIYAHIHVHTHQLYNHMPRVGYKSQVLEEVWRVIEDFEIIFQIDLYMIGYGIGSLSYVTSYSWWLSLGI